MKQVNHYFLLNAYSDMDMYRERGIMVAYQGTKGWYIMKLKEMGMTHHPVDRRKLELYKTYVVRNLYLDQINLVNENKN